MALNVGESSAVNTVIHHLVGDRRFNGQPVSRQDTIDALVLLTTAARKTLSAGYSADSAREALIARWPGALRQMWMLEMHGAEYGPYSGAAAARRKIVTDGGWPVDADLAWRTDTARGMLPPISVLYVNGQRTECSVWPATNDDGEARCRVCGCTEDDPCEGGCGWVTDGSLAVELCTACAWAIARDAVKSELYQHPLRAVHGPVHAASVDAVEHPGIPDYSGSSFWLAPTVVYEFEWRVASDGAVSPKMTGQEARAYIADQAKLYPGEAGSWRLQRREVGSWLDVRDDVDLDAVFEARGGLIPQPMLTEQEIDELQPLIAEVEPGDIARLDEIAEREQTSAIAAANDALTKLMDHVAIPTHMVIDDTHVIAEELDQRDRAKAVDDATSQHKLDEAAARVTAFLDVRDASLDATLPPGLSHMRIGPGVITSWHDGERDHLLTADDLRAILADRTRLAGEVEQLQVELGYALAPDEDDEPLTLRDVDPNAVYATEDDDERAEGYGFLAETEDQDYDDQGPF